MLVFLLLLALHHTSAVIQNKGLVHDSLEVLKILGLQSISQTIIQTIQKALLLLLISVYLVGSITR
jgi:hypothetical protein